MHEKKNKITGAPCRNGSQYALQNDPKKYTETNQSKQCVCLCMCIKIAMCERACKYVAIRYEVIACRCVSWGVSACI